MMTVSRLVVRTLARNQLTTGSEDIEESISPHRSCKFRFGLHQTVQLARAQPRHLKSGFQYKSEHSVSMADSLIVDPVSLVVRLPGYPQKLASPDDTQALDLPLGEDLPDRFFTTETP